MRRFPEIELSYETISHNKVSEIYDMCLAVPTGKKYFAWFTFHENKNVCYLFELNREKKISRVKIVPTLFSDSLALGTIVYGTLWSEPRNGTTIYERGREIPGVVLQDNLRLFFIIEDILYFQGIPMKVFPFGERLGFLQQFMNSITQRFETKEHVVFAMSVIWKVVLNEKMWNYPENIPINISETIVFPVHHIQYRSTKEIAPYLNVNILRKIQSGFQKNVVVHENEQLFDYSKRMDLSKPQYGLKTVFQVTADQQYDIYNLHAFGRNNQLVYFGIAYIPSYKSSVFMNSLFRKIRENKNLDFIEESDDEEDFQDTNENKYVDITKTLLMECVFHNKFKKWIPLRTVDKRTKVIHINKLIR
jgi:hypothetical protein